MQISHNRIISNYRLFFFKAILFYNFALVPAFASDVKIGSIAEIKGEVIAVGNGKILEDGKTRPLDVKKGDKILFGKYSGQSVKVDDIEYLVMREEDIMGIVE